MSKLTCCCYSSVVSPPPFIMYLTSFTSRHRLHCHALLPSASVLRRHHRRRLLKYSSDTTPNILNAKPATIFKLSDESLQITLTLPATSNSIHFLETKLDQFMEYGREALDDIRTIVAVDSDTGMMRISCRRSTVEFFAAALISSFLAIAGLRALFGFVRNVSKSGDEEVLVYRRDRSLGGREVLVGKRETSSSSSTTRSKSTTMTPLDFGDGDDEYYNYGRRRNKTGSWWGGKSSEKELPKWWPKVVNQGNYEYDGGDKGEYQRLANTLVRAIMDRKMSGKDISPNDVVQLRHICKTYGVKAIFDTENARDSLYRVSISFVLDYCESTYNLSSSTEINGEDVRVFVAGLADNVGLESTRAARMVSAAVAARTRSRILQAWALQVQNQDDESLAELFKLCVIHRIFPPEENSPEMEMVAQGLKKSLDVNQREHVLNLFIKVCGKEAADQSLVEALDLHNFLIVA